MTLVYINPNSTVAMTGRIVAAARIALQRWWMAHFAPPVCASRSVIAAYFIVFIP